MEKVTSTAGATCTAATCAQNTLKIISIIMRVAIMTFAGLAALCGIIAISRVEFSHIQDEAEYLQYNSAYWKYVINFNVLLCCVLLLFASGATLILEIVSLIVSVVKKNSMVFVIVDTVVSSISAAVLFCLAVGLATVIDAHATQVRNDPYSSYYYNDFDYGRSYPSTVPGRAASAFGFLTSFAVIGLIPLMWLKFYLEKRQSPA